MYRAYACGVGLPQRHDEMHWQKFLKDSHHRRMREMKPAIDNKAPLKFPHLQSNLKKQQMDEERYTWIERDNHHILDQLTRVTEATSSPQKEAQYKHRSMLADGQRKEFQRISADNSRLHRALNKIKPTVPSLKEVEIRTKDLERWYKNGCKLPDVLYDSSTSSPTVVESVSLPALVSPTRPAHRSFAHREITTDRQNGSNVRSSLVSKKQSHTNKTLQLGSPKLVGAGREFDASKSLICRLRPEFLSEVCDIKHCPAALRQLLQATCCALGEPSHAVACIECISDHSTVHRLSNFQSTTIDSKDADAFMGHMAVFSKVESAALQLSAGAQAAVNALQSWCLTLKQLLYVQQQELLSNQQFFEKQLQQRQPKGSKESQLQHSKKPDRIIHGLHPDDEHDSTISHLMQSLPEKKHILSDPIDDHVASNECCDEIEQLQDGADQEFEEDLDDLIEDRDTP